MKTAIKYIELKNSHHTDKDEAWIARVWSSSSGKTIYFNNMAIKRGQGSDSNHFNIETGDEYWISGVKKRGTNRHWGGSIYIEESLVQWYKRHTNGKSPADIILKPDLPQPDMTRFHKLENE